MSKKQLTLGSLFSGVGGFELAGILSDIKPIWNSEIDPFPIRVTTKRLPEVTPMGDVTAISGANLPPVDIITFGSPCQDMSIAGKRAGLDGARSGLFHEAVRIIKEMREKTNGTQPRFAVWENVPGCYSSNKGEDFRQVLEELLKIKDPGISVPLPKSGKWTYAGYVMGDGFSLAWRTLDAQYFRTAQRRRRCYLVCDFGSESAGFVQFESEGLYWNLKESSFPWERAATHAEDGTGAAGRTEAGGTAGRDAERVVLCDQGGERMDVLYGKAATLRAEAHHPPVVVDKAINCVDNLQDIADETTRSAGFCTEHSAKARSIGYQEECSPTLRAGVVPGVVSLENHPADGRLKIIEDGKTQTLAARMGTGGNSQPLAMVPTATAVSDKEICDNTLQRKELPPKTLKIRSGCDGGGKGPLVQDNLSATLATHNDQVVFVQNWDGGQVSPTLTANNADGSQRMPDKDHFNCVVQAYGVCSKSSHAMESDNPHSGFYEADTSRTLDRSGGNPTCNQGGIAVVSLQGSMIGRADENGPQGDGINEDVSFTLNTVDRHAVAYGLDRASFNQGKNAQYDPSILEEVQPTLTARGPGATAHPVNDPAYCVMTGSFTTVSTEVSPTLLSRDYKDPPVVGKPDKAQSDMETVSGKNTFGTLSASMGSKLWLGNQEAFSEDFFVFNPRYIVRRLTPWECARLQGFPDDWCDDLGTENPTDEEVAFWMQVFETWRLATDAKKKPKTEKQVRKWLADPYSDSAAYKAWGNGIALPCAAAVLSGIAYLYEHEEELKKDEVI